MSREVVVIGAGGHAKVVIATLQAAGLKVIAAFDDAKEKWGTKILDVEIKGPISKAGEIAGCQAVLAIGDNHFRRKLAENLKLSWCSVVHPSAVVHSSVRMAEGSVVFAGAVIQPDVVIGKHAIVNSSVSIDHDCAIGDFAHLAPGSILAGNVRVGEGTLLGVGTNVRPEIEIGAWSVLGVGTVVVKNISGNSTYVGSPARLLSSD